MGERVTVVVAQPVVAPDDAKARVSTETAQVVVAPNDAQARVSTEIAQAIVLPNDAKARVSTLVVQVIVPTVVVLDRTATDTISSSDSVSGTKIVPRTATDAISVSDSIKRTWTATDNTTVSDAVSRASATYPRSASDTTSVSESVGGASRTLSDTTQMFGDTAVRVLTLARSVTDTTSVSDSILATRFGRTATDTTTVSDSVSRSLGVLQRIAVDTVQGKDSLEYAAQIPVASFTYQPTTGYEPLRVQFTDTSLNYPTSWLWDFGDGATSTEQNPYHIYAAGSWTVSLTVTNDAGSDTVTI